MNEKVFERKLRVELKKLKNSYWFEKIEHQSIRGIPDISGVINGRAIYLETKGSLKEAIKKTKTNQLQNYRLLRLQEAGAVACFIYPENMANMYQQLLEMSHG